MQRFEMVRFIPRKNIFRVLVCLLSVFLILGLVSCGSSSPAVKAKSTNEKSETAAVAPQNQLPPLRSLQVNYVDTVTYALSPGEIETFHDPINKNYILDIPLDGTTYKQIWSYENRNLLSDAISLFLVNEQTNRLGIADFRSFNAYGTIDGKVDWFDNSTKATLSAEPKIDMGYIISNGKAYFLLTQRDSLITGGQTRSSRITICVNVEQIKILAETFECRLIQKPLLVFLGENVTAGYNADIQDSDNFSKAYPAVLQERLKINVLNSSVSYMSTADTLARVSEDVLKYDPDIVVINLGFRDFFDKVDPMDTTRNLQNIINILRQGDRKIYITRFYDERLLRFTMDDWELSAREQANLLSTYDTMFRNLSRNNNIDLITGIWDGLEYEDTIGEDYDNPTVEGQKIMAGNFFRALRPYLEANNFLK